MEPFVTLSSPGVPLDGANIDTDQIIPLHQMREYEREPGGFARSLFYNHRFDTDGREISPFVLNRPAFRKGRILVSDENFGCGSSREMAVWALRDFGFRAIIAPSFGDIFFQNCAQNGVLTVILPADACEKLRRHLHDDPGAMLSIDLLAQQVTGPDGAVYGFEIDAFRKECLMRGVDELQLSLEHMPAIEAWEARRDLTCPWLAGAAVISDIRDS